MLSIDLQIFRHFFYPLEIRAHILILLAPSECIASSKVWDLLPLLRLHKAALLLRSQHLVALTQALFQ